MSSSWKWPVAFSKLLLFAIDSRVDWVPSSMFLRAFDVRRVQHILGCPVLQRWSFSAPFRIEKNCVMTTNGSWGERIFIKFAWLCREKCRSVKSEKLSTFSNEIRSVIEYILWHFRTHAIKILLQSVIAVFYHCKCTSMSVSPSHNLSTNIYDRRSKTDRDVISLPWQLWCWYSLIINQFFIFIWIQLW